MYELSDTVIGLTRKYVIYLFLKNKIKNYKDLKTSNSLIFKKPMAETVIKLKNVSKRFGNLKAVNDISLEVRRGEVIGFVGPNGAGKTTTLKMIARLMKPNSGQIFVINKQKELQNLFKNPKELVEMGFLIDIPHFYNSTPIGY